MRSIATENKSYMGNGTYPAMSCYLQSSVSAWCRPSQSRNLHHCRHDQSLESSFPTSTKLTNSTLSHLQPRKEKPPNLTSTTKSTTPPMGSKAPAMSQSAHLQSSFTSVHTPQQDSATVHIPKPLVWPTGKRRIHPNPHTHLTATKAKQQKPPTPPQQQPPLHFRGLHRQAIRKRGAAIQLRAGCASP